MTTRLRFQVSKIDEARRHLPSAVIEDNGAGLMRVDKEHVEQAVAKIREVTDSTIYEEDHPKRVFIPGKDPSGS